MLYQYFDLFVQVAALYLQFKKEETALSGCKQTLWNQLTH